MKIINGIPPKLPPNTYADLDIGFWNRANILSNEECWEWQQHKMWGYGYITINGRDRRAHRVAWELAHGEIPVGLMVLHQCDNRACINPSHLYLGTHADNMRDVRLRKRNPGGHGFPAGESHPRTKLKDSDIISIRQAYADGKPPSEISLQYSVCRQTIWKILHRQTRLENENYKRSAS